jgi:hypothetical protein
MTDSEDEATIVVFPGGKALVMPGGIYGFQCTAKTRAGKRCKLPVEGGQIGSWRELVSREGIITVYDVTHMKELHVRRWLDQRCERHDSLDTQDDVMPEWEPLDPDRLHKNLVKPLPEQWELPTRGPEY